MKPYLLLLAGASLAAIPVAPTLGQPVQPGASDQAGRLPSASAVLASVRSAVGYDRLTDLGAAYKVQEVTADGRPQELLFGVRRGELRRGNDFWYDGAQAWQVDERRNITIPSALRQREKAAWPMWVRGYWWLNPQSRFTVRVLPGKSDSRQIALALSFPEGLVGATVFVDRDTWLPERVVVPYERGPFTERYSDYRRVAGVLFPFIVETSYRDTSRRQVSSVTSLGSLASFKRPPLPNDHSFERSAPAALQTLQGTPFSKSTPGHVYVRGSVDGERSGWWHFDTGSDSMIIDEALAQDMGMEVVGTHRSMGADGNPREGTWRKVKSFQLGRIRIENMVMRAMDLSKNNAPAGERRMGTIGYDLLARAVVEYGDGGNIVRICNPSTYRLPRGRRWQRLEHIDSTPGFRGVAEGFAGLFQLDTGASGAIDFTKHFHERNRMLEGRKTQEMQSLGSGGQFAVRVARISEFHLAGKAFRDLEVSFRTGGISREGSAGTVGREVMSAFTMVFDYSNQRLAFLPPNTAGTCG